MSGGGAGGGCFAVENRADSQSAKRERTKAELRSVEHERKAAEKELASVEKRIKVQQARVAKVDRELILA